MEEDDNCMEASSGRILEASVSMPFPNKEFIFFLFFLARFPLWFF